MTYDFEYLIIGAGGMGSAAAYHLASAGRSVLLLEQFQIGHTHGSSHGESRIIRLSYDHVTYVQLAQAAYRLWADLAVDARQQVITPTGGLDLSAPLNPAFEACVASLSALHIRRELLNTIEARRRFPQFQVPDGAIGLYQADAGSLNPAQCVRLMVDQAVARGAVLQERTPARSIEVDEQGAQIITDDAVYHCRKLIVTAGPWTGPLLETLGVKLPLTVTHEHYAFFKPRHPEMFQPGRFPIFVHYGLPHGSEAQHIDHYGVPIVTHKGVKIGEHHAGPVVSADMRSLEADPARLQRLSDYVRAMLPDTSGEVLEAVTCLYTNTPDQHFCIGALPGCPHVFTAAGFSGHGFKFAILVGRILADLATTGQTTYPLDLFSLKRWG